MKLGEFLEAKRIAKGQTLRDLSISSNVPASSLSRMERNRFPFQEEDIKLCAKIYECDVEELKKLDASLIEPLSDEEIVKKLPIFLNKQLSEDQLNKIIEIIRHS